MTTPDIATKIARSDRTAAQLSRLVIISMALLEAAAIAVVFLSHSWAMR